MAQARTVVWKRHVDTVVASRRWRTFRLWFVLPAVLVTVIVGIIAGPMEALGVVIVAVLFGVMIGSWIWLVGFGRRQNGLIELVDGRLVVGATSVELDRIECWTTHRTDKAYQDTASPEAVVIFRLPMMDGDERGVRPDGGPAFETEEFGWGVMQQAELDEVRAAIAEHVTAPWVTIDDLRR